MGKKKYCLLCSAMVRHKSKKVSWGKRARKCSPSPESSIPVSNSVSVSVPVSISVLFSWNCSARILCKSDVVIKFLCHHLLLLSDNNVAIHTMCVCVCVAAFTCINFAQLTASHFA